MDGVVTTTSLLVVDGIVTWCAVSSFGCQIVKGSTFVTPPFTVRPARPHTASRSARCP